MNTLDQDNLCKGCSASVWVSIDETYEKLKKHLYMKLRRPPGKYIKKG